MIPISLIKKLRLRDVEKPAQVTEIIMMEWSKLRTTNARVHTLPLSFNTTHPPAYKDFLFPFAK